MYEVEVKVPADLERVRRQLDELDAERLESVVQADTYYDAPHRSFPETDEALRVRRESVESRPADDEAGASEDADDSGADEREPRTRLTYKGPLIDDESKSRLEHETGVEDGEALGAILERLGFDPAATVRKERERYDLEGYTVTLDSVDDVGEFVEVEVEIADEEIGAARDGALATLERLGLEPGERIRTSYLELLLE